MAKKILDTYYITRTKEELESMLQKIIIERIDSKIEKRRQLLEREFLNIGHAGEYICNYLKRSIED